MELTTRSASWGIEIKTDEIKCEIYKPSINKETCESNYFIQNLLQVTEDICAMRNETIFEYLENHYDIKIFKNEED